MIKKAFILAAGLGARLGEITKTTPKPLVDIGGTSPLIRSLKLLEQAGIQEVAINTHKFSEDIKAAVKNLNTPLKITFFYEAEPLETGGAIKNARAFFNEEPFLLINGDAVWLEEDCQLLKPLMANFAETGSDALLTLVPLYITEKFRFSGKGDFYLDNNLIKLPTAEQIAPYVYAGIAIIHPRLINSVEKEKNKFSLYKCFVTASQNARLNGLIYNGTWVDMGSPAGLEYARGLLAENIRQVG